MQDFWKVDFSLNFNIVPVGEVIMASNVKNDYVEILDVR